MNRNNLWKWLLVLFVVGWALWEMNPPRSRNLIAQFEDMASGIDTNFTAIVKQARELEKERPTRTFGNLREAIGTNDITRYFPAIKVANEKDPAKAILHKVQKAAAGKIKLGLDLQGGTEFVMGVNTTNVLQKTGETNEVDSAANDAILEQAIEVLRKRVDKFGVAEPVLQPGGNNTIRIQLPGLSEASVEEAKTTLQKAAFLEFRLVHPQSEDLLKQGLSAPGYDKLIEKRTRNGQESFYTYLVKKKPEGGLTGKYVSSAGVIRDPLSNQPQITLNFNSEGAEIFARITRDNVGRLLAIVLDGELYSAPRINDVISGGRATITGDFDLREAFTLANVLMNPLEAPVELLEQRSVDPSLGKDSMQSGVRSAIYGVVAVAFFMLVYYLVSGVIANIALILNVVILLGVLCAVGTTLTLPGIAGIVLTIGMAVDANVLIYERIREELAAGKSLRGALAAGYDKAFGTIFDSNLTTLIASTILIFMGTGPVKGFGVTLTIGVLVSMFTALVVTRLFFDFLLARGMIKDLKMLHIVKGTNFNFLKLAKPAFVLSWLLIFAGWGYGFSRGGDVMGVDFAGGDSVSFSFAQKIPVEDVRKALDAAQVGDAVIQYQRSALDDRESLQVIAEFKKAPDVERALTSTFPNAKFQHVATDQVGPVIGSQILRSALISIFLALLGILVYVAMRYEFSFAVGAVVAVIHDILMALGVFFLFGRQLNAPIVAAVLTIIGFSINDTIVIFDRIREDLKLGIRGSFMDLINRALNQTLSRTIITSGTVFLATLSLYLFGGGVINDFAFIFLVGILVGTYSSIYIASALVLWWHKGQRPSIAAPVVTENVVPARV